MPLLNDDAIYVGGIQAEFTGAPVNGQVSVKWSFTIGASESFSNYDPSAGLVPSNFVFDGSDFSVPSAVSLSQVNSSSTSGTNVSAGLKISGTETSGTPQSIDLWAVYTRVR